MAIDAKDEPDNLVHLTVRDFAGWAPDDEWGDEALRIADDASMTKAAYVGEERWRTKVELFVSKPFRAIPIEYFTTQSSARTWLAD
jgi:hypothetical protein